MWGKEKYLLGKRKKQMGETVRKGKRMKREEDERRRSDENRLKRKDEKGRDSQRVSYEGVLKENIILSYLGGEYNN